MKILVHYKNITHRCSRFKPSLVVSITDSQGKLLATLPAKLVKDQLTQVASSPAELSTRQIEAGIMLHMTSAFLSTAYLYNVSVLSILIRMARAIIIFEDSEVSRGQTEETTKYKVLF